MYRRKTVEALLRQNARERDLLLKTICEQSDRIMVLAGQPPLVDRTPAEPLDDFGFALDDELDPNDTEAPAFGNPY